MIHEGEIHVGVHWDGDRVVQTAIRSTRPFVAGRLLVGKSVADAVATVPLLFSVCGRSQSVAAAAACEAASGVSPDDATRAARDVLVEAETVQEVLSRMLIDWPRTLGEALDASAVAAVRRGIATATAGIAGANAYQAAAVPAAVHAAAVAVREAGTPCTTEELLGERPGAWLAGSVVEWLRRSDAPAARRLRALRDRSPALGASDVPLLATIGEDAVRTHLAPALAADPAFERTPSWLGAPAETGALARMQGHPAIAGLLHETGRSVLARLTARLTELASILAGEPRPRHGAVTLAAGEGAGWVETARGLLLHRASARDGRIVGYRIVAPTEWNFHPCGALCRGLTGARFASEPELRLGIALVAHSLDPCVAFSMEVRGA